MEEDTRNYSPTVMFRGTTCFRNKSLIGLVFLKSNKQIPIQAMYIYIYMIQIKIAEPDSVVV